MIIIINNIDPDLWTVFGGLYTKDLFHSRHFLNLMAWQGWTGLSTFFNSY